MICAVEIRYAVGSFQTETISFPIPTQFFHLGQSQSFFVQSVLLDSRVTRKN